MAFGGFARYTVTFWPMVDPQGRSLRQSRVCVDGSGVGYLTDAGAFLAAVSLPPDVVQAITYAAEQRGIAANVVPMPDVSEIESLIAGVDGEDDDSES